MANHIATDSEARLFGEWQGRVTQALEHLKESMEKIESDRTTRRDYQMLCENVARLQTTVDDLPNVVQVAVTKAYEKAEGSFNQRLSDIGVFDLRSKVETLQTDIATQKEATSSLKETALRYGLLGGGLPAGLIILASILYFLLTGKVPPA
jgi:hypothetical protein